VSLAQSPIFQVGTEVAGRYRLEEFRGSGASGEVWRSVRVLNHAEQEFELEEFAVKILKDDQLRRAGKEWFEEINTLGALTQADGTIPKVTDWGHWENHLFIVMEYLSGETLRALLKREGRVPWRRALFIARRIAMALQAAAECDQFPASVVHCDIKPENIQLVDRNRVCVLDWGIARRELSRAVPTKAPVEDGATAIPDPDLSPESTGQVGGTKGYMAPEAYREGPVQRARDVFALGVVLYEMLAGTMPHDVPPLEMILSSEDRAAHTGLVHRATQLCSFVPLAKRNPEVPPGVVALVDALLVADPEERKQIKLLEQIEHAERFPYGVPEEPYPGLSPLDTLHAGLYYGQDGNIEHVLRELQDERAVLLRGASGRGKSSLAIAGVAGRMDRTRFDGKDGWRVHVVRPHDPHSLRTAPGTASSQDSRLGDVVIVDQLEELLQIDEEARRPFCDAFDALILGNVPVAVSGAVLDPAHVRVIATVRNDLWSQVNAAVPQLTILKSRRVQVNPIDVNCVREMLLEPARAATHEIEEAESVEEEIAQFLVSDPGGLPAVQFALSEWWRRRDVERRVLTHAAWSRLSGVKGALSTVAEEFYDSLPPEATLPVRGLFLRLFRNGQRLLLRGQDLTPSERELMDRLDQARLVRRSSGSGQPDTTYELAHELLATSWLRARDWYEADGSDIQRAKELERAAVDWEREHDPGLLLRNPALRTAEDLSRRVELTPIAHAFIKQAQRAQREDEEQNRRRSEERRQTVVAREKAERERLELVAAREKAERERLEAVAAKEKAELERVNADLARETAAAAAFRIKTEMERTAARNAKSEHTLRVRQVIIIGVVGFVVLLAALLGAVFLKRSADAEVDTEKRALDADKRALDMETSARREIQEAKDYADTSRDEAEKAKNDFRNALEELKEKVKHAYSLRQLAAIQDEIRSKEEGYLKAPPPIHVAPKPPVVVPNTTSRTTEILGEPQ
jgi:serine/threonine protein kinase